MRTKSYSIYEQNEGQLDDILNGSNKIEKHIDNYERNAINMGDLKRAIRYNWLRNTYKQGLIDDDGVFFQLMTIHADSYVKKTIV